MRTKLPLLFLLLTTAVLAQNHRQGRVSLEEMKKTESALEKDAAAEILYQKANIVLKLDDDGVFRITKEYEGRIKIYDKDKVDESLLQQEVLVYGFANRNRERLMNFKGSTYNLDNGKIVQTRVRNADIFKEKKNKYWETEKFTFPNVQNGSVLEYSYTIVSPLYRDIGRWYFQHEVPVLSSELNFKHPEFFSYNIDQRGQLNGKSKTTSRQEHKRDYNYVLTEHSFTDVPSLKQEPHVFNLNNLKASIRYELTLFSHPGYITENYATSWNQIAKDLMNHSDFGDQLKGNRFLDETVERLTAGVTSEGDKMSAIFQYVKNNYAWNQINGILTETGIRNTFNNKTGNAADLNLMLVAMLNKAGLKASPVVLSTVKNLLLNYTFPSRTGLNFVIAAVEINGQMHLMDATAKYSNINMLPMRDLNHRGFKITERGATEISLINYSTSNIKEIAAIVLEPNGRISGSLAETKDAYFAMNDKIQQTEDPKKFEKKYLSKFNFDVEDFNIEENTENGIFRYVTKFENVQGAEVIGDKIIFNPLLFSQLKKTTFNSDSRNYPLEFGTQYTIYKRFRIKIPEGFAIEQLPENKSFILEDDLAAYAYKIEEENGHIIISTVYQIERSFLPSSFYSAMKEFEINQFNTESQSVVLKKI